ncbi:type II toxin-antitoxin system VapC family toxin [Streptomyces sp. 6N223]|uniref:type II toxin-antitoxin system VapC family toxin n=1 Tax=Streptomyces sp. 6N223 TaxID=3457412 RepID=UPI003FD17DBB
MTRLIYLDTSAALKLIKRETESDALAAWLSTEGSATVLTCDLTRTEMRRALHALGTSPAVLRDAEEWLEECALIRMPPDLFRRAGDLSHGSRLRSLDALHCAAAMKLGAALTAFVAYDKRLVEIAASLGLPVKSPGR